MASDVPELADPVLATSADLPIACSLTDADRHARGAVVATLFSHVVRTRELPDGYAFAFSANASQAQDLLDFIVFERACCPFFTFALTFPSPHDVVWLHLRGGVDVKAFVRDSFAALVAGADPLADTRQDTEQSPNSQEESRANAQG